MATTSASGAQQGDEEAPQYAALDRIRTSELRLNGEAGMEATEKLDVDEMDVEDRHHVVERILGDDTEGDNERFLSKLRARLDRVGIDLPKIEIRYSHLNVEGQAQHGSRATPSLPNLFRSAIEWPWQMLGVIEKVTVNILSDVTGILKPTRLTLLLGPPGSGRTTFLRALAGRLNPDLQVSGEITYNGHHMREFVPRKTSAYISQHDLQPPELTVRENLDFYRRLQGVGDRQEMLTELTKREKAAGIKPEADVDLYLKATAVVGQSTNLRTDYLMKVMGLDNCADTPIGNAMCRGISGGQKKRVTTAEMLVGPAKVFFMDEISTGLDTSTTFQITKMLQHTVHLMEYTIVVSLLQPTPEIYALFDDLILLAEGQIVYQGPCSSVLEFMACMGFKCPDRKATADFLQEVTSPKDQEQYWADKSVPYEYVTVPRFVEGFKTFHVGQSMQRELATPYDKSRSHPKAFVYDKYALSTCELLKACFAREVILMKRHMSMYKTKVIQTAVIAVIAGTLFLNTRLHHDTLDSAIVNMGALFYALMFVMVAGLTELTFTVTRLPIYCKEKELSLYPAWAISIPMFLVRIPVTVLETGVYLVIVYVPTGFSLEPGRFFRLFLILILINQATVGMCRFVGAAARTRVAGENLGAIVYISTVLLGGFVLSRDSMPVWWKWASWCSVLFYAQEAASVNEYGSKQWDKPLGNTTLGAAALETRGLETKGDWVWISIAALVGFVILFNILLTLSLHYIDRGGPIVRSCAVKPQKGSAKGSTRFSIGGDCPQRDNVSQQSLKKEAEKSADRLSGSPDLDNKKPLKSMRKYLPSVVREAASTIERVHADYGSQNAKSEMVLPFKPLSVSFDRINYYVDMPEAMKKKDSTGGRLQLLNSVSGAFRPGVLTALVGVTGAGNHEVLSNSTVGRAGRAALLIVVSTLAGGRGHRYRLILAFPGCSGKTTLLDVLAGRKTRGHVEGTVHISGYPKNQSTFTRVAGYCEQNDIHSPNVTVFESLVFSAWLRLSPKEVDKNTRMTFVEEVMRLVELDLLRDSIVGTPGVSGLSTGQRKRLTIAVELVANPSIIFMDEPTSGLDARAAAIVMRAVRNIGNTGRTVACTIHQPSIDIFEAFDELLLLTLGGKTIYAGPLGRNSRHLINYFEAVSGVPKIKEGYNPATWQLEVTSHSMESKLGVNFAEIYVQSSAYRKNAAIVKQLRRPQPGHKDLEFPTVYAQSFWVQCLACFWKVAMSYWRNTTYTGLKIWFTICLGCLLGSIFWGQKRDTQQDVFNMMGALYCSVMFLGFNSTMTVQPIVGSERIVYYRERGSGMYSSLSYAMAQFSIEVPFVCFQTILFTGLVYSMMKLEWHTDKVLWFLFFMFFTLLFYVAYGFVTVAATPNAQLAAILANSFFSVFNLFQGFIISVKQIPVWWRWLYWCSPTAWGLYGLIGSQLGDVETFIDVPDYPGQQMTVKEYLNYYYGYEHNFLKYVAIEQVTIVVFLALVYALCIKYCNFQRR